MEFHIGSRVVGAQYPTYFVADISANHDGDLERARALIRLAAEAGADSAKFQNFRAPEIVSRHGFEAMGEQLSHQSKWRRSVYEVYEDASLPWEWTETLKQECDDAGIEYASTPYDFEAVDMLDAYVRYYKIGSGDITWPEMLDKVASKGKPVVLSTGASDIGDVQRAMKVLSQHDVPVALMQCNTNYTADLENFRHIHLNVLRTYRLMFPEVVLGLSDHTPGHSTVLGAVALGARIVEKHFTDDPGREGPDHPFSMTPASWREMVERTREVEVALGGAEKFITENEADTVVVQRRCVRARKPLTKGDPLTREDLHMLRPAPRDGIYPYEIDCVIGMRVTQDIPAGEHLRWSVLVGDDS